MTIQSTGKRPPSAMRARSTEFVRNSWYAAAWVEEIGDTPFSRTILDEPMVLFRNDEETVSVLADQCPHRLLPLSMGVCTNGHIRCGYHGMEFDGSGQCTSIPGQSTIPPTARVQSYPSVQRYGIVWVWMGEPDAADESLLPVVQKYGEEGWGLLDQGYQHHPASYRIIIENLMDPAHTTFVHKMTIGNPSAKDTPVKVERRDGGIITHRWVLGSKPSPYDLQLLENAPDTVDRGQFFCFFAPSMSLVDMRTLPAGCAEQEDKQDSGLRTFSYKFLTPETAGSTHFFWLHVRNYRLGEPEWEERLRADLNKTYFEDRDVEGAIQLEQERTGVRQRTALAIDRGPVMAMSLIDRLLDAERGDAGAAEKVAEAID